MSNAHFDTLPALALQLALEVDRYRAASRDLAFHPQDEAAREAASASLRAAGVLAFAIPALWASWGDMVVRHSAFTGQWLQSAPPHDLQRAWRHLEDRAEIVTQRCVDWALRRHSHRHVAAPVAQLFLAWDEARREAFGMARQFDAIREMDAPPGAAGAVSQALRERHDHASREAKRLLEAAAAALHAPQASPAPAPAAADPLLGFEALHDQWRIAEDAAAAAELSIFEMDLQGLPITPAQRERAAELRAQARAHRQAILEARQL